MSEDNDTNDTDTKFAFHPGQITKGYCLPVADNNGQFVIMAPTIEALSNLVRIQNINGGEVPISAVQEAHLICVRKSRQANASNHP